MGDMVEHAHNRLFEVLSEIGLVGGVTFVGGLLGTLVAGGLLLRRRLRGRAMAVYRAAGRDCGPDDRRLLFVGPALPGYQPSSSRC